MIFRKVMSLVQKPCAWRFLSTTRAVKNLDYLETSNSYAMLPSTEKKLLIKQPLLKSEEISDDMLLSKAKRDEFMTYFPGIVKELKDKASTIDQIENGEHMARVLEYAADGGKKYAGVVVVETYKILLPQSQRTPENLKLGYYLGWCLEMLLDSMIMADDIMDGGKTRRNKICWYQLQDVQLTAINDSFLIKTGVNYLLRKHFGHLNCFMRLLELFNETAFMTYMGQHIDMMASQNFLNISMKNYEAIIMNASSYIASYCPVVLGMTLAGYTDTEIVRKARPILTELGYHYLIEDDFMDCFGDPEITGNVATDIQEGKCRWLAVACLERATPAQRDIMKNHYGRDNPESVAIVKKLYLDLNLPQVYAEYSNEVYNRLMKNVEENSYGDLKKVYLKLIDTMTCSTAVGGLFP